MYRALRTNCIVKVLKVEEKSSGGIIINTQVSAEKENMAREEGIILHFGPDFFLDSKNKDFRSQVREGDKVVFARYGGKSLGKDKDGNELRVMRDIDILAVEEDEVNGNR